MFSDGLKGGKNQLQQSSGNYSQTFYWVIIIHKAAANKGWSGCIISGYDILFEHLHPAQDGQPVLKHHSPGLQ